MNPGRLISGIIVMVLELDELDKNFPYGDTDVVISYL